MNMPGFTAEATLYRQSGNYWMHGTHLARAGSVLPALLDMRCYRRCYPLCTISCYETGGFLCGRECRIECREACTV
jgi:hypothetical protein